ncbi:hypothetical protein HMPREF1981_01976 [Bacteroides pyogenes F0041]|uniref:Uncharacterized protein n=1 Tax=Bacteroides pyogenes F0041 TaxID=1321819 RepID=U2CKL5_9BACE|nr:hypothetical protein HMPREF1981_01976 [Bacteroides pyogenes F0041]GAE21302.1 hypothetical protein JCM10003_730 [Bacteroides pyogenes JCM 10003]
MCLLTYRIEQNAVSAIGCERSWKYGGFLFLPKKYLCLERRVLKKFPFCESHCNFACKL